MGWACNRVKWWTCARRQTCACISCAACGAARLFSTRNLILFHGWCRLKLFCFQSLSHVAGNTVCIGGYTRASKSRRIAAESRSIHTNLSACLSLETSIRRSAKEDTRPGFFQRRAGETKLETLFRLKEQCPDDGTPRDITMFSTVLLSLILRLSLSS